MEAICRTWEKLRVLGEDAPEFRGGGADEFLSREEDGMNMKSYGEEKGKGYTDVFIR